jgi:hypothetical protein
VRRRPLRPLPARALLRLPRRTGLPLSPRSAGSSGPRGSKPSPANGSITMDAKKPPHRPSAEPRLAVHKFSSCDGCQLALLNAGEACSPWPSSSTSSTSPRPAWSTRRRRPTSPGRGQHLHPRGARARQSCARTQPLADTHRCLRHRGRAPGPAQPGRHDGLDRRRLSAAPSTSGPCLPPPPSRDHVPVDARAARAVR